MGNMHKKRVEDRTCRSEDRIADRQTHTNRQTDTLITILRCPIGGGVMRTVGWVLCLRQDCRRGRTVHASNQLSEKVKTARLPSRAQQLTALRSKHFDVLVVGGGATGCGVALDAVSRGVANVTLPVR